MPMVYVASTAPVMRLMLEGLVPERVGKIYLAPLEMGFHVCPDWLWNAYVVYLEFWCPGVNA